MGSAPKRIEWRRRAPSGVGIIATGHHWERTMPQAKRGADQSSASTLPNKTAAASEFELMKTRCERHLGRIFRLNARNDSGPPKKKVGAWPQATPRDNRVSSLPPFVASRGTLTPPSITLAMVGYPWIGDAFAPVEPARALQIDAGIDHLSSPLAAATGSSWSAT